ncbi:hypothetical protein [Butyrivibrio sp. FCS014]|uniref:hypothetical protein n=1 Tax=Butyrivibrio sp. FCS014 TaxID=1408304 RepID=UPI0004642FEA|nr:hypothetical protein [Butyrivibrio sp. FCS014]
MNTLLVVDSAVQNRKYAEISAVIYSPESIFVIMNNYRMAKEDDKDTARTLLLKNLISAK